MRILVSVVVTRAAIMKNENSILVGRHFRGTLKEETFAERNFRDFREFWANSRKLFPRKILQRLIRESFFSRKKCEKQSIREIFQVFGLKLEGIIN